MNTAADALAAIVTNAEIMSTEARKAQERGNGSRYGRKFEAARAQYMAGVYFLQAHNRAAWAYITSDNKVSTDAARALLASRGVAA